MTSLLRINNFCHFKYFQIDFKKEILLIEGANGTGKSTIPQAFKWLLYGGTRDVKPIDGDAKDHTWVDWTIFSSDGKVTMNIYRAASPYKALKITKGDVVLEDTAAQDYIVELYGSKRMWQECCYLKQKTRCILVSGTAPEKHAFLNSLCFHEEDPQTKIDLIQQVIKITQVEFERSIAEYTPKNTILMNDMKQRPVDTNKQLSQEQITVLQSKIADLDKKFVAASQEKQRQDVILNNISYLTTKLVTPKQMSSSHRPKQLILSDIEKLKLAFSLNSFFTERDRIITLLSSLSQLEEKKLPVLDLITTPVTPPTYPTLPKTKYSVSDIANVSSIETKINTRKSLIDSLSSLLGKSLELDKITTMREERESKLNKIIMNRPLLEKWKRRMVLAMELKEAKEKKRITLEQLEIAKRSRHVVSCPHCSGNIRIQGDTLVKSEYGGISEKELEHLEIMRNDTIKIENKERELASLQSLEKIDDLAELTDEEVKREREIIEKMREIEALKSILTPEKSSGEMDIENKVIKYEEVKLLLEYNEKMKQYQSQMKEIENENMKRRNMYEKEMKEYQTNMNKINEKKQLEMRLVDLNKYLEGKEKPDYTIQNEITKLQLELDEIEKIETEQNKYTEQKKEIERLQTMIGKRVEQKDINDIIDERKKIVDDINEHNYVAAMMVRINQNNAECEKLNKLRDDFTNVNKLKEIAIQSAYKMLDPMVSSLNTALADILTDIFSDEINVSLQTVKELKTLELKYQINIATSYRGKKRNDIKSMSGGEGDAISLGLTMVLSELNIFPYLFLDEFTSSLDTNVKEFCYKQIKKHIQKGKGVIVIEHNAEKTIHDRIITLK